MRGYRRSVNGGETDDTMCGLVVRRLIPGTYDDFRRAWEPLSEDEWPRGMTRPWIGRADDDENVVAVWSLFQLDDGEP